MQTKATKPPQPGRLAAARWPMIIVAFLAGHMLLMAVCVTLAVTGRTQAVESDYYTKATQHDQHRAAQRASDALGWAFAISPAALPDADGRRRVTLELQDAQRQPIDAAAVSVLLFHHAAADEQTTAEAQRFAPGAYELWLPSARPGVWELRTSATRGDQLFLDKREIIVQPPHPGATR